MDLRAKVKSPLALAIGGPDAPIDSLLARGWLLHDVHCRVGRAVAEDVSNYRSILPALVESAMETATRRADSVTGVPD